MSMDTRIDMKKKKLLAALEKELGIVLYACKTAKIPRASYYKWYRDDPEFAEAADKIGDLALDFAESALHKNIKAGKETSIIFFLKTKGKKRGYIEKVQQEITGGNIEVNISKTYDK